MLTYSLAKFEFIANVVLKVSSGFKANLNVVVVYLKTLDLCSIKLLTGTALEHASPKCRLCLRTVVFLQPVVC